MSGGDSISIGEEPITATIEKRPTDTYSFRKPLKDDGADVWELIKNTGVLDLNSSYSYLMWCEFFADTSIVIEHKENIVGFVSGFIQPSAPDTLFIWQVVVDEAERGKGLATRMLLQLVKRFTDGGLQYLEATVTPSNIPSQQLFRGLAEKLNTRCTVSECFSTDDFPEDEHEAEMIYRVGPFFN